MVASSIADRSGVVFTSIDSAPQRFTGPVPLYRAPAVLALFVVVSIGLLWLVNRSPIAIWFPAHDLVFSAYTGSHIIAMRLFSLAFFIAFAAFAQGNWAARTMLGVDMIASYMLLCGGLDLINFASTKLLNITLTLTFCEVVSGLLGFAIFSIRLVERGRMPSRIRLTHVTHRKKRARFKLGLTLVLAIVFAHLIDAQNFAFIHHLREVALLGGIGPGVFLVLPLFFMQLYVLSVTGRWFRPTSQDKPPITVIVPAYNEEYIIARTIAAIDRAAIHYGGEVTVLILDNNSHDTTAQIAATALGHCVAARGKVVSIPQPGKSHALNAGLDMTQTDILLRVDADTEIGEDNLTLAVQNFGDPEVGVVGGVPLPPGGGLFDRARLVEVLVKHGFYSVALTTVNGLVGVPGMFVLYRTHLVRELGGFVEGMNGEDTDVSLRIGELGYRLLVDPKIRFISEVPASYIHMREQRMRWFRSVYHISSRCRDLIYSDWPTLRGKVILPYMMLNSGRRAMLIPLLLFGLTEYIAGFNETRDLPWQSIAAVAIGAPAIVGVVASLLNRMPIGVLAVPEYLIFRLLRAYFTLESMLSITISPQWLAFARPTRRDIVPDKAVRVA
ncbi:MULTISPECIES: glycosyltransferase [unclassified Yoonia]|uniref:glycosyltransferase n=1 Tax=unclassified Yoonia TaxID=2629118 RepID=UPI002AFFCA21|nr:MULTISPECIES: glycosyltransferase [unclassified Yoonia]